MSKLSNFKDSYSTASVGFSASRPETIWPEGRIGIPEESTLFPGGAAEPVQSCCWSIVRLPWHDMSGRCGAQNHNFCEREFISIASLHDKEVACWLLRRKHTRHMRRNAGLGRVLDHHPVPQGLSPPSRGVVLLLHLQSQHLEAGPVC